LPLIRLQKVIADAGIASRRRAEAIIIEGRVRVNGKTVRELGTRVDPHVDRIAVDGRTIHAEKTVTVLLNKPRGVVCTADDPEGRETVVDLVHKIKARLYPVGRLDFATSGALLMTNDGPLAHALTHPKFGVEKTYLLKVRGPVEESTLEKWRKGVDIGDVVTRPAIVARVEEEENYTWVEVTISEGRNRQIRRMAEATDLDVIKLKRISFAGLTIERIRVGQYRELTARELARLKRDYVSKSRSKPTVAPQDEEKKPTRRGKTTRPAPTTDKSRQKPNKRKRNVAKT